MIISIFAGYFVLDYLELAPGDGLILLVLSMVIYGMAFDFLNISVLCL